MRAFASRPAGAFAASAVHTQSRTQLCATAGNSIPSLDAVVIEAERKHRCSVIFMHGLGDTGDGWGSLMPQIDAVLPPALRGSIRWICPHAPQRPITLNGGLRMPGWFDLRGLTADEEEDAEGLSAAAAQIEELVERERAAGIPTERILVGGFSQGGALALHVGLRSTTRYAGVAVLSTWLPLAADYPASISEAARDTPFLVAHGDADMVVSHAWGQGSFSKLEEAGLNARFVTAPGVGHGADAMMLREVAGFVEAALGASGGGEGEAALSA